MSKVLKSWISLGNYEYLEKLTKKFLISTKDKCIIVDDEDRIEGQSQALEGYLSSQYPGNSFTIIDISSLPKDTKTCLVIKRHEPK